MVKICPACGARCPGKLFRCAKCGFDMASVKPAQKKCPLCGKIGFELEVCACGRDIQDVPVYDPKAEAQAKICVCGTENVRAADRCRECGRPLADIPECEPGTVRYLLLSADLLCRIPVSDRPVTVGRGVETCGDYLLDRGEVSRRHLQFTVLEDGSLFATDSGSRYGTWLNGREMPRGRARPADDGDEFSLCGPDSEIRFRVVRVRKAGDV